MRTLSFLGLILVCLVLGLAGCNAEHNTSTVDLGSVSIGEQLIDLKKARDEGALSGSEYRKLKNELLTLVEKAGTNASPQNAPEQNTPVERDSEHQHTDSEDTESGFLF